MPLYNQVGNLPVWSVYILTVEIVLQVVYFVIHVTCQVITLVLDP
jgi:hypothetical protein